MSADLHTHSRWSDGLTTPAQNAALAAAAGLRAVALTDHDTTAGLAEAAEACRRHGVELVPGIELSAELEGRSVHVLGYWVDPEDPALAAECARLRGERDRRAAAMVGKLNAAGVDVTLQRVRELAGDAPVGRPHLAAALVEAGAVPDFDAAFTEWIGDGAPAHEPKRALHPVEAVRLLRAAGGVAVLAHPGAPERAAGGVGMGLVDALVAAGLDGIEADSTAHDEATSRTWRLVALERDLVVTGSSDFHGRRSEARIGERTTSAEALARLAARPRARAVRVT